MAIPGAGRSVYGCFEEEMIINYNKTTYSNKRELFMAEIQDLKINAH